MQAGGKEIGATNLNYETGENDECMTGNEFVKTWNSLFRLKEDAHRPDKCLGQADFVEIIQENINANAP